MSFFLNISKTKSTKFISLTKFVKNESGQYCNYSYV